MGASKRILVLAAATGAFLLGPTVLTPTTVDGIEATSATPMAGGFEWATGPADGSSTAGGDTTDGGFEWA